MTLNELYERWKTLKRGIREMTMNGYVDRYENHVKNSLGKKKITDIKKSDVMRFYNKLVDEKNLMPSSVNTVNIVLHQVFELAVEDDCLNKNPTDNIMREFNFMHSDKKRKKCAMTKVEQDLFLNFLKGKRKYFHLNNIATVMLCTGMRVGEVIGLRYCDINFEENYIDVNHSLSYYNHTKEGKKEGNSFSAHKPKTRMSIRKIPMMDCVREAILREKEYQETFGIKCTVSIDGYTDFVFRTRNGRVKTPSAVYNSISTAIQAFNKQKNNIEKISHVSPHKFRHTFATRLCEAGTNIKAVQALMGHSTSSITLDIYTDASESLNNDAIHGAEHLFSY